MTSTKIKLLGQKFTEAWTACMVCMVQGDLTVITTNHALAASKTGIIAGLAVVLASYIKIFNNRWSIIWLTGLATSLADMISHPSHFGEYWTEAVVTGFGAMLLAYFMSKYTRIK